MTSPGDELRRRLTAALDDPAASLHADDPAERRVALAACVASGPDDATLTDVLRAALDDDDATLRRDAAEAVGRRAPCARALYAPLVALLTAPPDGTDDGDDDTARTAAAAVREAAAFALGESDVDDAADVLVAALDTERSPLVRESIAAALGALGRPHTLDTVCALTTGEKPAVRRRAVIALAAFDDPAADAAIDRALADRDRFVREAAEWLTR